MKIFYNKQTILLAIGIFIFAGYQFQIYWGLNSVRESVLYIEGGGAQRLFIKLLGITILYIALIRHFSIQSFFNNFTIKIPLLYYILTVIVLIPLFLSKDYTYAAEHILAVNLILFTPILFLNLNGEIGDRLFSKLIKITVFIICIQLSADLIIKLYGFSLVSTILGGMGNANTFGLHLIIAALGLRFIHRQHLLSNFILIMSWGTGSLICALLAFFFLTQSLIIGFYKRSLSTYLLIGIVAIALIMYGNTLFSIFFEGYGPVQHVFTKINELLLGEADNVLARISFMKDALALIETSPMSIIFGHPNMIPFWTTDGFFLALFVTLGLPALLLFIFSHIYLIYQGSKEKTPLYQFATYTLIVYLAFFCTNRILDYWPAGFLYLLVFTYLSRKIKYTKNNYYNEK
mgnify:CR=1 FL=1